MFPFSMVVFHSYIKLPEGTVDDSSEGEWFKFLIPSPRPPGFRMRPPSLTCTKRGKAQRSASRRKQLGTDGKLFFDIFLGSSNTRRICLGDPTGNSGSSRMFREVSVVMSRAASSHLDYLTAPSIPHFAVSPLAQEGKLPILPIAPVISGDTKTHQPQAHQT